MTTIKVTKMTPAEIEASHDDSNRGDQNTVAAHEITGMSQEALLKRMAELRAELETR